jgi:catalase
MVIPDGPTAIKELSLQGAAIEFLKDQYRHCKPILALGAGADLFAAANIPMLLPDQSPDPGLLHFEADDISTATAAFAAAIGKHRHFVRQTDPPRV